MKKLTFWFGCLMLIVAPVLAQEQISREIPLQFANAVEVAAVLGGRPVPKPAEGDFEGFIKRCLTTVFADFPHNAWNWQTYMETQSETRAALDQPEATSGKPLPKGMAEPPVAVTERNALRVKGTSAALAEMGQMIEALDRPVPQVGLQVDFLRLTPEERDKMPGVTWTTLKGDETARKVLPISATGNSAQLLTSLKSYSAGLSTELCVRNGRSADVRVAEVLPSLLVLQQNGPPAASGQGRFLRLALRQVSTPTTACPLGLRASSWRQ